MFLPFEPGDDDDEFEGDELIEEPEDINDLIILCDKFKLWDSV